MGSGSSSGFASSCRSQNQTPRGNRTRLVLLRRLCSVRLKAVSELHCIRFSGPWRGVRSNFFSGFSGFRCAGVRTNNMLIGTSLRAALGGWQRCSALDVGGPWGPMGEAQKTGKTTQQLKKKRRRHTYLWRLARRYLAVINDATTAQVMAGGKRQTTSTGTVVKLQRTRPKRYSAAAPTAAPVERA